VSVSKGQKVQRGLAGGLFLSLVAVLLVGFGDPQSGLREPPRIGPPRVLFVGNSFTYKNDLPAMFDALARAGGHAVEVDQAAPPGWLLAQHAASHTTLSKIARLSWDYVILQEASFTPCDARDRDTLMYPAARLLDARIRAVGATPVFFTTWGWRGGRPARGLADFDAMQACLTSAYMTIAKELDDPVAPVGIAWQTALKQDPTLELFQSDDYHPTVTGSYLAACVFYAMIYRQRPEGLPYTAGLDTETARLLQRVATDTVLTDLGRWNIRR
jgi:hypothetical protein